MGNYNFVRANFCVPAPTAPANFYQLFKDLHFQGCCYNQFLLGTVSGYLSSVNRSLNTTETVLSIGFDDGKIGQISDYLSVPGYLTITLQWQVDAVSYVARIVKISRPEEQIFRFAFELEEKFFFDGDAIELSNWNTWRIQQYEAMIVAILRNVSPVWGVIDYESDLDCTEIEAGPSLVSWGIFLSQPLVNNWASDKFVKLPTYVDRFIPLNELGILLFLYPLRANQAWTERHESLKHFLTKSIF